MAELTELASERYYLLVDQIRQELGGERGWLAEAARRLDVAPSYMSKIASGAAGKIGYSAVQRAIASLGISRRFFSSEMIDPSDYRRFVVPEEDRHGSLRAASAAPVVKTEEIERQRAVWRNLVAQAEAIRLGKGGTEIDDYAALTKFVSDFWAALPHAEMSVALRDGPGYEGDVLAKTDEPPHWVTQARRAANHVYLFWRYFSWCEALDPSGPPTIYSDDNGD